MKRIACVVALTFVLAIPVLAQGEDAEGCTDHPLFTRMPGSLIASCEKNDFNSYNFKTGSDKTVDVEGKYAVLSYEMKEGLKSIPSVVQILRNFENAVKQSGGKLVYLDKEEDKETLQLKKNGKEFWVEVYANISGRHTITIVEKSGMVQDIVANADAFSNDLKATGHAAVYGIYFDSGKSEIKPESEKAISEVARLLQGEAGLKVYVVGHTDNEGGMDANLKLSKSRADAVVQVLVQKHGIASSRLKSFGAGPCAPVASNDSDDGKAKNRRVELVKD